MTFQRITGPILSYIVVFDEDHGQFQANVCKEFFMSNFAGMTASILMRCFKTAS
jgi:hypothetical protein